jgi:hypothetical protein
MRTGLGLLGVAALFTFTITTALAQEAHVCAPPAPKTHIGAFEERPGALIVKGSSPLGSIGCVFGSITVVCKESTDVVSTQKVFGAAVSVKGRDRALDTTLLDADELDSLLKALPRMNGPQWGDTSMTSFEAVWSSKDGLRITTFNNLATGSIEAAIQSTHYPVQATAVLSPAQLETFRSLVEQAKGKIDSIRQRL